MSAVRPVFRDGARLTAGQLNATVKYLRDSLRRFALAPFSPGAAAGLLLQPVGVRGFRVDPGVAVDGRGRILVLETPIEYIMNTAGQLLQVGGGPTPVANFPSGGAAYMVRLQLAESADEDADVSCSPAGASFGITEGVRVVFEEIDEPRENIELYLQLANQGCVDPWADLDGPSTGSCAVQLGTVVGAAPSTFAASSFFRQGISARFSMVRSSINTPSILLGKLPGPTNEIQDAVYFNVPSGGVFAQSNWLAPYGARAAAGTYIPADPRVFLSPGGAGPAGIGSIGGGLGGLMAIPCASASPEGAVVVAGIPLSMQHSLDPARVFVKRYAAGDDDAAFGLSAATEYLVGVTRVIPVAVAGLLRCTVSSASDVELGADLSAFDLNTLSPSVSGQRVIARAAQRMTAGTAQIYVWVQHPGVKKA